MPACILEAHDSTRKRLVRTIQRSWRSHYGKGVQLVELLQSGAKAAVDNAWEKLEQLSVWQMTKAQTKEGHSGSTKKSKEKSKLSCWWTSVVSKMLSQNRSIKITKARLYSEVTHWKTILALTKTNMLTPTTKSQTCWPKILSFVISGITFSCVSQHESFDVFLQPFQSN